MSIKTVFIIFLLVCCFAITTCEWKLEKVMKVSTVPVTNKTTTTVVSGGNVIDEGNSNIRARGVCWSTSSNPTIALNTKTSDSTGAGIFTSKITGLSANTTYYVRAYATNSEETGYGDTVRFTTNPIIPPTVTTGTTAATSTTMASSGGNVTSDGGATVTARGVCWNTSSNPTIALSTKTSDGTGTGIFTSNITSLTANTTYHVRAYATNSEGTGYGIDLTFSTDPVSVSDVDGNVYSLVRIGSQLWIKENLKTTKYNDGKEISNVTGNLEWAFLTTHDAYCWYDNNIVNKDVYGALYNWYAVNTGKLCPSGWRVPTDAEWKILEMNLGMTQVQANTTGWRGTNEGGKLKEAETLHWKSPNTGATNASNFTALPGGYRYDFYGTFDDISYYGRWWSTPETDSTTAWSRHLSYDYSSVSRSSSPKYYGLSVRCLRNQSTQ